MASPAGVALASLLLGAAAAPAPQPTPVPRPVVTFEELLAAQSRAEASGDASAASSALAEIRRVRIERNVESHETLGLALVRRGLEQLGKGERDAAEAEFRDAVALAPGLPDAHFALAVSLLRKGPLGVVPSVRATLGGAVAFLETARGELKARDLLTVVWLLFVFGLGTTVAVALLLRRGPLLRHDLEESLGSNRRSLALGVHLMLLVLPLAGLQGWGWLPLWWLALLFAYFDLRERLLVGALLLATLSVGPALSSLELRERTAANPLYAAALSAIEGAPDPPAIARLEEAARADPQDRDLAYLVAAALKRSGHYDQAADLYRRMLAADPADAYARNNLANIEFVRGAYDSAVARYTAGAGGGSSPEIAATSYYNLSLAYLQKFDYQAYNEAKSNADRLARPLVSQYDKWKYDSGDYAVVDLGLTPEQVWGKIAGETSGTVARNLAAGGQAFAPPPIQAGWLLNRFSAALGVFAVVAFLVGRWRGPKAFTERCGKCGTAFCRLCHLGQASGELCSQCYHLYVVRDGVSGPARNRKMAEVQRADARRERMFRVLSVLAPGAGHVYAGRIRIGFPLLVVWYFVVALILATRVVPLTDAPSRLVPPWPLIGAVILLIAAWLSANRLSPDFEVALPVRRPGARRPRVAQGA